MESKNNHQKSYRIFWLVCLIRSSPLLAEVDSGKRSRAIELVEKPHAWQMP
ncbi:MAG: hypothetical protein ABIJ12_07095 [bacterium]